MSYPTIPDLPVASSVNDSDQLLVRQPAGGAGTDKSATVALIRNLNIAGLPAAPATPSPADLLIFSQGGTNYQLRFDQVGFVQGVKMWFFHNLYTEVSGWSLFSSGDTLLAVKGGSTYTVGGVEKGSWQQEDHILTINEMPAHSHNRESSSDTVSHIGTEYYRSGDPFHSKGFFPSSITGGSQGHNHGSTWRPKASVGIILEKN